MLVLKIKSWWLSRWKFWSCQNPPKNESLLKLFVKQFKIHKWSEDKSIAMNVERDVGQCTIWKFTNYWMTSQLQWFWKRCRKTHNLKIHKWSEGKSIALNEDRGAGRRTILKSEMIGWLVDCNVCGKRCRRGHNLKIHKWSDVKSIAINVEWIAGQRTILRLENDRIASRLQSMWKEMQNNAQFQIRKW